MPINVKMNLADHDQVMAAIAEAIQSNFMLDDLVPAQVDEILRSINQVLVDARVLMIQPGNGIQDA
jgi:hypothetical protein